MRYPEIIEEGSPYPLGATWDGRGVNFALFSEHAERVELCLFEAPDDPRETVRIPMRGHTENVWHLYLPEARPGLAYGYRVHGPHDPRSGLRFNPNKLLLDPYARSITGGIDWSDALFGYPLDDAEDRDLQMSESDSAPGMPRAIVIEPAFSWGDDHPPRTPWSETVIYEAHVKGLTQINARVPEELRGTYAGLAHHRMVDYLRYLGVTAVELMPVHHLVHDRHLVDRGLRNYWGYNSIGFFAPDPRYASANRPGAVVNEFKTMVRSLHSAGLEVILDVVYNHTAEGNHLGPTLSFRGIDNDAYYRLVPGDERYYMDYTGTGNSLNMRHPRAIQLIMDSLRYWATEMHVDGFRFDLAATLARELHEVDRLSAFFDIIQQDPVLSKLKLIAEPWDVGEGGYQVGNFPVLWTEWNGEYRDTVRRYWRGDAGQLGDLGYRLTGSSDLYAHNGRRPYASINFVTAHDGFTLRDLVSYNDKHNEANGEENRDGANDNQSWNCGAEGETDDPAVLQLRAQQQRNFLATLFLSQGVPMLLHGDEVGRSQGGNNNAYCQDNEISWMSWDWTEEDRALLRWTRRMIAFRAEHPALSRTTFFQGRPVRGTGLQDIAWFAPDGTEMTDGDWGDHERRSLGMLLANPGPSDGWGGTTETGALLVLLNASHEAAPFTLPPVPRPLRWVLSFDTARPEEPPGRQTFLGRRTYPLGPRALAVLAYPGRSAPSTNPSPRRARAVRTA